MKKFVITLVAFFSIPILISAIIIFLYIKRDVYSDFGYHNNFSWKYGFQTLGDISTKKLLNSPAKYNSFIFGSSRAVGLYACYLQKKIPGSKFFHYANWTETIGGIYAKLKLLDSLGYSLDNIVFYFDTDYSFAGSGDCLYNDHYLLTNNSKYKSKIDHFQNFILTMDSDKLKILLGYEVRGSVFPNWESDTITNDSKHICSDSILNDYGVKKSLTENTNILDTLSEYIKKQQISENEEKTLISIHEILKKHNSKYYIIITPLSDQLKFNSQDLNIIRNIFGRNVYDFSGANKYTLNKNNYNDKIHFLDYISKEIVDSVIVDR